MKEPKVKEYDIEEMSWFQIECKIEEIENVRYFYLDKLQAIENLQNPKTSQLKEILAHGGDTTTLFDRYLVKVEEADKNNYLIKAIELKAEVSMLKRYLERQKAIISKYDLKDQEIIYLKEKGYTWLYIANKVNYSIRQCQRIYDKYIKNRKKD